MITIFTSSHNHGHFLSDAIHGVLGQTHGDFEYLLYDDGSKDDTGKIMDSVSDSRARVFHLDKQANVGALINRSVLDASGDYWCWCPADDVFSDRLIEKKLPHLDGSVVYHDWFIINDRGTVTGMDEVPKMTNEEFYESVKKSSPIGFTGIMIPMDVMRRVPFPEHLDFSEDFYWMINATLNGVRFKGIREKLHYKRKHSGSTTSKNIDRILAQVPLIRQELYGGA